MFKESLNEGFNCLINRSPRVVEKWHGTTASEKLHRCSRTWDSGAAVCQVCCYLCNLKTFCGRATGAVKWKNPEEQPPRISQAWNWQVKCEVAADCQIDAHVTTWRILGILSSAFPPLTIIHSAHNSQREIYGRYYQIQPWDLTSHFQWGQAFQYNVQLMLAY